MQKEIKIPLIVLMASVFLAFVLGIKANADDIYFLNTGSGSSNVTQLNDLSDVIINSPIDNQLLTYNGTFWLNENGTAFTCNISDGFICWNLGVNDITPFNLRIETTGGMPLQINSTGNSASAISIITGATSNGNSPQIRFLRAGNNSIFPTAITDNMVIGTSQVRGYDGDSYELSGAFRFSASENWDNDSHGTDMQITCSLNSGSDNVVCLNVDPTSIIIGNPQRLTLVNTGLTAVRTYDFPDRSGEVLLYDHAVITVTSNYTTTDSDEIVLCDASGGSRTITLNTPSSTLNKIMHIKRIDTTIANSCTIDTAGSEKLETLDSRTLNTVNNIFSGIIIVWSGSNWFITGTF